MEINKIYCGDAGELLEALEPGSIDLTITSPPYGELRDYKGYSFDFERIARGLYQATKPGGVVVWIVNDETTDGSESGSSFRQALYFKDIGFNLHDTMIWNKGQYSAVGSLAVRYGPVFEYMFILSKGLPKTFNPIKDRKSKHAGTLIHGTVRQKDGSTRPVSGEDKRHPEHGQRFNIWDLSPVTENRKGDHPAPFPEALARDHIISWSDPGDLILDPMCGSGTTLKAAKEAGRFWLGFEISEEYCELARRRVASANVPLPGLLEGAE